mmetsp:Transcript_32575/g.56407  ORF Transcript_32575/g.56407 Transcript_32575/m.56407 type:complete len:921 (-) Transcript_32575:6301-9063(-)
MHDRSYLVKALSTDLEHVIGNSASQERSPSEPLKTSNSEKLAELGTWAKSFEKPSSLSKSKRHRYATQYQCLSLGKRMIMRTDEQAKHVDGLESCSGLFPLARDGRFFPGILRNLKERPEGEGVKLLIAVSMFNEKPDEVINTLSGIIDNLAYFRQHGISPKDICCVVICDGLDFFMAAVNESRRSKHFFKQFFNLQAVYEKFNVKNTKELGNLIESELKSEDNPDPEFAHCFQLTATKEEDSAEALQLIWAVKHFNKRKLNTHLWFFGGFCELLQPKYCQLIDVGTRPKPDAIWRLYERLELDPKIAGCCGEIVPMNAKYWNFIEAAQIVEYKYAHLFDKALESLVGYITVLPGAFSAYRWESLKGGPLWNDYFKSLCHPELMNAYYSNIYLAEDRVLCLALVSQQKKKNILKYIRSSIAETDVPEDFFKLLAQRRRWINGSWFALIDTLKNRKRINRSGHSCMRKFWLWFLMGYYTLNVLFSWFMVGGFFLAMAVMTRKLTNVIADNTGLSKGFMYVVYSAFVLLYLILLIINFFLAMGMKPHMAQGPYRWLPRFFAFYMLFIVALTIVFGISDDYSQSWAPWLIIATIGSFTITPILYGVFHKILPFFLSFLLMTPTYVNIFVTYAMCNIHDCTWGNRPDQLTPNEIMKADEFKSFRAKWVVVWVLSNAAFAYFLNVVDKASNSEADSSAYGVSSYIYIYTITVYAILLLVIRFIFSMIFLIQTTCCRKRLPKLELPLLENSRAVVLVKGLEDKTEEPKKIMPKADPKVEPKTAEPKTAIIPATSPDPPTSHLQIPKVGSKPAIHIREANDPEMLVLDNRSKRKDDPYIEVVTPPSILVRPIRETDGHIEFPQIHGSASLKVGPDFKLNFQAELDFPDMDEDVQLRRPNTMKMEGSSSRRKHKRKKSSSSSSSSSSS